MFPLKTEPQDDPRTSLARALAEVHIETQAAEHDYRRTLAEGADHMESRYPAAMLEQRPQDLNHFSWHKGAMAETKEKNGISEIPPLPFPPSSPNQG